MNRSFPCIWLCDIETSIEWYAGFLGFNCSYKSSLKNPEFAIVEKNDLKIYMIQSDNPDKYASNTIVIETDGLEKAFKEIDKAGCIILQTVEEGLFGGKEFIFKDYEDNKIIFHQSA